MGVGRGYGKLLLFGEHAAVYGYPAVGMPIDRSIVVEATPADRWRFPPEIGCECGEALLKAIGELPGEIPPPASVRFSGDLPLGVGFGSSAAFCVGLLRAIGPAEPDSTGTADLWDRAHRLEHVFHGRPSGIDTGLSLSPEASALVPSPPELPRINRIALPTGWLVVCAIERSSSTAELVRSVGERRETDRQSTDETLSQLGRIAQEVTEGCADGGSMSIDQLGRLASEAQHSLVSLDVSTDRLDSAIAELTAAGALGAKLSGAGGGGAFFGVFADQTSALSAETRMKAWLIANDLRVDGESCCWVMPIGPSR